ncbi:hypothetical protein ACOMHN_011242 [Nucella lapillus]
MDEQRLYQKLRENHEPYTRPVYNASKTVTVEIGITLIQIIDMKWEDEKLHWDPADYNNLQTLRVPSDHIWKPDIILYNNVEVDKDGYMKALANVHNDGHIFWSPIVKFHSTCEIDITFFPFDDQVCHLKLGSWAYDGFQVNIVQRSSGIDLSNYVRNGEWVLLKVESFRKVVIYPCCPEPFPDVRIILYLRRRIQYYLINVIGPCVMLSTLTLLVFWLTPESGEKINLGLTVILAYSVFMLLVAENMPSTSIAVPVIGIYLTSVMGMTSMSVFMAVVVSNISNIQGYSTKPMHPTFAACIIKMARFACYRLHHITPDTIKLSRTVRKDRISRVMNHGISSNFETKMGVQGTATEQANKPLSSNTRTGVSSVCAQKEEMPQEAHINLMEGNNPSPETENILNHVIVDNQGTSPGPMNRLTSARRSTAVTLRDDFLVACKKFEEGAGGGGTKQMTSNPDMKDILFSLQKMMTQEETNSRGKTVGKEWREAAEVIDRYLFFLTFLATLLTTITALVILPLSNKQLDGSRFL